MRFTFSSISSTGCARHMVGGARRDFFLGGSVLLTLGGWVVLNPPPRAPRLPSACQAKLRHENVKMEMPADKGITVWVDPPTGFYYFPVDPHFGQTRHGKYLPIKAARAEGFRSRMTTSAP